jgi:hypothetical protein
MMRAVMNAGSKPKAEEDRMHARTIVCEAQYGEKSAPIRFQSTRFPTVGLLG